MGDAKQRYEAYVEQLNYVPPIADEYIAELLSERDQLRQRLAALLSNEEAGIRRTRGRWYANICSYCGVEGDTPSKIQHAPDCPIVLGRQALAGGE